MVEVLKALKVLDSKRPSSPHGLDCYVLKLSAEMIAEPLTLIFNLTLFTNSIPKVWKEAYALSIFKSGKPDDLGNYHPFSFVSSHKNHGDTGKCLVKIIPAGQLHAEPRIIRFYIRPQHYNCCHTSIS